jgi:uncharacterized membrane protein
MPTNASTHGSRGLRARGLSVTLALALLAGSGCDGGAPDGPRIPDGATGDLLLADDELAFRACDADEPLRVEDHTGRDLRRVIEDLGYGSGTVRVHLVLDGARVTELRVAVPESGVPCAELLPAGEVQARGNEPFWNVTVNGAEARWRSPEELDGEAFDEGSWRQDDDAWRYEARRDHADGVEYLVVVLREEPCRDSMSGAHYPFRAEAERGGDRFEGCGLEGRGGPLDAR